MSAFFFTCDHFEPFLFSFELRFIQLTLKHSAQIFFRNVERNSANSIKVTQLPLLTCLTLASAC